MTAETDKCLFITKSKSGDLVVHCLEGMQHLDDIGRREYMDELAKHEIESEYMSHEAYKTSVWPQLIEEGNPAREPFMQISDRSKARELERWNKDKHLYE